MLLDKPAAVPVRTPRIWWILTVVSIAQLMIVLDTTIVNIALPSAQRDLGFSEANRQWVITAYALTFGTLLLLGGKIADLVGRRRAFVIGLVGFGIVSVAAGAAPNGGVLIAARAVQGGFAALLAPAALSLLSTTFTDPKQRGAAFGVFGAIGGGGSAIGLLLGGALTEYLDWRWTLYVNAAFAVAAVVGTYAFIAKDRQREKVHIDLPGAVLISVGLFGIVFAMAHAETDGWSNPLTLVLLIVGVLLVGAFVQVQRRVADPLVPLRVVLDRTRGGALLSLLMTAVGMFAVFLFVTYYMQDTLGYSAVKSGLAFLPLAGAVIVAAGLGAQALAPRVSVRILLPLGTLLSGVALVLFTRLDAQSSYATDLLPGMIVFGLGTGLIFGVGTSMGTIDVRREDAGVASALVNTMQQVGGSIGIAFLSTIAASAASDYVGTHLRTSPTTAAGREVIGQAAVHGYTHVYWWAAAVFAVGTIATFLLLPSRTVDLEAASTAPVA